MTEVVICDECGEPIEVTETVIVMAAQVDVAPAGAAEPDWRDGLIFSYHVDCAPGELVGLWRRVS